MTSWHEARDIAAVVGRDAPTRVLTVPLARAAGLVLAGDVRCERPLPRFDNSAMDGWAVAGEGPWQVGEPVLAGSIPPSIPLEPGHARPIATGAPVPPGTSTVLRSEDAISEPEGDGSVIDALATPDPGCDIRREGEEAAPDETLLPGGAVLTPPGIGLLAAAGVAEVDVSAPPLVTFVAIGDELGAPELDPGHVTDSLTPMMPALLAALGARCATTARALDRPADVATAIRRARTETVVTSGGTAHGPADPLRAALDRLEARILIDGVDLRPGGSVLLARLPDGRHVLSLPGNPLAAVIALLIVGWPLLQARVGRGVPVPTPCTAALQAGLAGIAPADGRERAVACVLSDGVLTPVPHQRSGMLRGIAGATHLAMIRGSHGELVRLPWACV